MKALSNRMLWFPKGSLTPAMLKRAKQELLVSTTPYRGPPKRIALWEHHKDDGAFGVPREWGRRQKWMHDRITIGDDTTCPYIQWPQFSGTYRPGQDKSVAAIYKAFIQQGKRGALLDAPCGSGKTIMCLDIAAQTQTPALVLVHKDDLAKQWHEAGELFPGARGGHVQGDNWDYKNCHFVTAMAQTLHSRKGKEPKDFYKQFGMVIYDEGHRYPARTFELVMRLPWARFRLGCSATWRRNDGMDCIWSWHVGGVEHRMRAVRLTGEYAQVVWNTNVTDSMFKRGKFLNNAAYITAIGNTAKYNQWLADQLLEGAKAGRKALLVSHRIAQLQDIRQRLMQIVKSAPTVGYYVGSINGKKMTAEQLSASARCQIILGTFKKLSEGTDIPTLDTLYLATPAADVEQVVGRIQRHHADKKSLLVVDPYWQTSYNKALAAKRRQVYRKLGFVPQKCN